MRITYLEEKKKSNQNKGVKSKTDYIDVIYTRYKIKRLVNLKIIFFLFVYFPSQK